MNQPITHTRAPTIRRSLDIVNRDVDNAAAKAKRVLIADDSAAIRSSLSGLLQRIPGIEIVGLACTGLEAWEMIHSLKPDVVTLDIRMPEFNGLSVLEALQKEGITPYVIVLTGLDDVEYRRKCTDLGAAHFFHKATEFEKVIEVLTQYAHQQNAAPSSQPSVT